MGKRSVRVFLALVFALLLPGSPAWAGDGAPVSMEVSTVYGDMGKFGSHIPLVITFYGQSETPFNGTVNVKTLESTPDNSDEVYQYSFPVSVKLAETEKKEIYIPLGQKSSGIHVALCDQKKSVDDFGDYAATIRELGIDLSLGENYLEGFKGQDIIMRTPGFVGYFEKPLQDAMAAGTMVTSEVELFFDFCPCEIVGVTGSDGKTTTTTLISKFYEAAGRKVHLGGNIGAALLPMLPEVAPEDVAVVELSSFQLISMHKSPKIAVVTNVTPNHLDHHKDMQEYIDAKRNILLYQTPPCRAVLGYENEISRSMQKDCKGKQVWFTRLHDTDNGAFLRKDGMLCMAEDGVVTPFLAQKDVKLRGLHNIENLLAAAAAVWGLVPVEAIQQVGSTFTGVEHRIEPVRTLDGVLYYNDSIGTSPTRTIAGLRSFNQKVILIAGGYDKHIPYEPLAPEVIAHVKNLVLMGATGPRIEKAVRECEGFDKAALPIQHADNMQHAVELARAAAKPGDIIILSPASASFDLYPNFEVRGREFKKIVNALK